MKKENFEKIISSITGRDFTIDAEQTIEPDTTYYVYRILPISKRRIGFKFKTPKKEGTLIKSFVTQFSNKYLEPNPAHYDGRYPGSIKWDDMSDDDKEFAYYHHRSNMYSKQALLEQVRENSLKKETEHVFSRFGFYETNYGIGLYILFGINNLTAVRTMKAYLDKLGVHYTNEFSDAKWVLRFVINAGKDVHRTILNEFNKEV